MLRCPICALALQQQNKQFLCSNHHSFDIAKEGYLNLLVKNSTNHGDNKQMVQARSHFLNQDYYQPLCTELITLLKTYQPQCTSILDLGCGQGYYTKQIKEAFLKCDVIGIDISKEAISYASKLDKESTYLVASNAKLPLFDTSIDTALCLFSYVDYQETSRVLTEHGLLFVVSPHKSHLYELKQAVYDTPYCNDITLLDIPGFHRLEAKQVSYRIHLPSNAAIMELFGMTPYAYKTKPGDIQKLATLKELEVEVSFLIQLLQKVT